VTLNDLESHFSSYYKPPYVKGGCLSLTVSVCATGIFHTGLGLGLQKGTADQIHGARDQRWSNKGLATANKITQIDLLRSYVAPHLA